MERSWSPPVAQALQRHTGSWKLPPPETLATTSSPACTPSEPTSINAVADTLPATDQLRRDPASRC
jgi:hypothetical protein